MLIIMHSRIIDPRMHTTPERSTWVFADQAEGEGEGVEGARVGGCRGVFLGMRRGGHRGGERGTAGRAYVVGGKACFDVLRVRGVCSGMRQCGNRGGGRETGGTKRWAVRRVFRCPPSCPRSSLWWAPVREDRRGGRGREVVRHALFVSLVSCMLSSACCRCGGILEDKKGTVSRPVFANPFVGAMHLYIIPTKKSTSAIQCRV